MDTADMYSGGESEKIVGKALAFGFLTGRHRKNHPVQTEGRAAIRPEWFDPADPVTARKLDIVEELVTVADDLGCTLPALATAWPLHHRAVTSVLLGPRTLDQLTASLGSAEVNIDDAALNRIDEIVPPGDRRV